MLEGFQFLSELLSPNKNGLSLDTSSNFMISQRERAEPSLECCLAELPSPRSVIKLNRKLLFIQTSSDGAHHYTLEFQAKFKYLCKNVISIFIANNEICVRCTV